MVGKACLLLLLLFATFAAAAAGEEGGARNEYARGTALAKEGKHEEALRFFRSVVGTSTPAPGAVDCLFRAVLHTRIGHLLNDMGGGAGRVEESRRHLVAARAFDQTHYQGRGRRGGRRRSQNARVHASLGVVLARQRRFGEALASYKRASHVDPSFPSKCICIGATHVLAGHMERAIRAYGVVRRGALREMLGDAAVRGGGNGAAHVLLNQFVSSSNGAMTALTKCGRLEEALATFRASESQLRVLRPDNSAGALIDGEASLRYNHGLALLAAGRLVEGWAELSEWRWRSNMEGPNMLTSVWREFPPSTPWDNGDSLSVAAQEAAKDTSAHGTHPAAGLAHSSVLVWKEQGLGDEILLASVVPDLIRDLCAAVGGGRLVVEVSAKLLPLFTRSFAAGTHACDSVLGSNGADASVEVDIVRYPLRGEDLDASPWGPALLSLPIGGLPMFYRRRVSQFRTSGDGHLLADPVRHKHWRARLREAAGREGFGQRSAFTAVGIAWRSSITTPGRATFYAKPADLAPIFQLDNVLICNLQYDLTAAESEEIALMFGARTLVTFPDLDLYNDLDEAAAFMSTLDIVISPLISTVDLAGALGIATWVFSPTHAHDRFLGTQGMPWYPSARVFAKQQWTEPWPSVFARMAAAIMHTRCCGGA